MKFLIVHGPNMNLLGKRKPEIYGTRSLNDLNGDIEKHAESRGIEVEIVQSNIEGEIIDHIQRALGKSLGFAPDPVRPRTLPACNQRRPKRYESIGLPSSSKAFCSPSSASRP